MLGKPLVLGTLLLVAIGAVWLYQVILPRATDGEAYRSLLAQKELAASHNPTSTSQHRKGVRKDIWFAQDSTNRLHYKIESEHSLLTLTPRENRFEIVEMLHGIKCWMQDKLVQSFNEEQPMQQARYIEADDGLYHYSTHEFTANGVALSLFRLPGHTLPTKPTATPFLEGVARDISFYFSGKTPQFRAEEFQAKVVDE